MIDSGRSGFPVLCFNMGSSSLKFDFYILRGNDESLLAGGEVERIGLQNGRLWIRGPQKELLEDARGDFTRHESAIAAIFSALDRLRLPRPAAAGHRIVHGGREYTDPAIVDPRLMETLRGLIAFAPLHLPAEIQVIEAVARRFPELPQVACFDTAFHRRMPEIAQRLPLPRALWDEGVRRYGFHGLSYEYILYALGEAAAGRVIIAHLGNGASMAAVRDGRPLDTTMGLTPAGGLMMGTRCGDIDPGVLLFLMNERGYDTSQIDRLVNRQSGLLGVSLISPDMKTLLERREDEPRADQAVRMFCYHLRKGIGALAAVLEGVETLVFTGGIGEYAGPVRGETCRGLRYLGIHLDPEKNGINAEIISTPSSPCTVRVIHTNEELLIARHTRRLILSGA
jgi:acetate kinase